MQFATAQSSTTQTVPEFNREADELAILRPGRALVAARRSASGAFSYSQA